MKPRRLLSSVDPLPTISETHEEVPHGSQSLDDYVDSIKELAQPGPLRVPRTQRPRMFAKHPTAAFTPRRAARIRRHRAPVCPDEAALKPGSATDPLDWLFAQTQNNSQRRCVSSNL